MSNVITEGMRAGDLEDMVLPLISVDEYESKVDENAVVFGFYVGDHSAALDLNRFIQKSPVMIIDTDVSPAPDSHGNYLVFVELLRNERLGENLAEVLDEVSPLAKIENWQMRVRGVDRLVPFSEQAVESHLSDKEKEEEEPESEHDDVLEFLQPSDLGRARIVEGRLVLEGYGYRTEFDIIEFDELDAVLVRQGLQESPLDLDMQNVAVGMSLDRMLGEGWTSSRIGGLNLLMHADSDKVLALRNR